MAKARTVCDDAAVVEHTRNECIVDKRQDPQPSWARAVSRMRRLVGHKVLISEQRPNVETDGARNS